MMKKESGKVKKLLLGAILLLAVLGSPLPAMSQVSISVGIALPPPILFPAPPIVVVLPDTDDVYVVPDIAVEIFFWSGFWWRPWEGRWYRSRYYDRGWAYFDSVPRFYYEVDPGWRVYYREHNWHGHGWNYQRVPNRQLQRNWRTWHNNRHWEGRRTWNVQSYQPRPPQQRQELRHQREMEYRQRPEVQRHEQQRQERQMQPRVQEPRRPPQRPEPQQHQPRVQEPPRQMQPQHMEQHPPRAPEHMGGPPHQQPQGRPGGGDGEHGR